jgi:hypothetical protein
VPAQERVREGRVGVDADDLAGENEVAEAAGERMVCNPFSNTTPSSVKPAKLGSRVPGAGFAAREAVG